MQIYTLRNVFQKKYSSKYCIFVYYTTLNFLDCFIYMKPAIAYLLNCQHTDILEQPTAYTAPLRYSSINTEHHGQLSLVIQCKTGTFINKLNFLIFLISFYTNYTLAFLCFNYLLRSNLSGIHFYPSAKRGVLPRGCVVPTTTLVSMLLLIYINV